MNAPCDDAEPGAVLEHTAHTAIAAARHYAAAAVAFYNPTAQAAAEKHLAYRHNTADELRGKDGTR